MRGLFVNHFSSLVQKIFEFCHCSSHLVAEDSHLPASTGTLLPHLTLHGMIDADVLQVRLGYAAIHGMFPQFGEPLQGWLRVRSVRQGEGVYHDAELLNHAP